MSNNEQITYFAETDARNQRVPFGIKEEDRSRHVYLIGKTGMGKSTLLENMAVQDILNGNGMAFIDPHGGTADLLLEYVPKERMDDVVYFAPFDMEYPVAFNVMEDVGFDKRHLVVSGLMSTFKKIWQDAWSARMEYILSNTLLALLEYPDSTLLSVNKMLSDAQFRKKVVDNLKDESVRSFWVDEFANYTERMAAEATPAIQNKIGQFTSNPVIRNILGQPKSSIDMRKIMDEKKILIINLSKGRIGEENARLLGSMIVTKLYLAAMSRADATHQEMKNLPSFYLFVDEFQSFANESFADILSEARKYKLALTITHQYIEQMPEEVRAAVFGNVGSMITFRVGANDAEHLEKEFAPTFMAQDIVNLDKFQIYLRLMIDSVGSQPFSAVTLPPIEKPAVSMATELIAASRKNFAAPRADVEKEVMKLITEGRDAREALEKKKNEQRAKSKMQQGKGGPGGPGGQKGGYQGGKPGGAGAGGYQGNKQAGHQGSSGGQGGNTGNAVGNKFDGNKTGGHQGNSAGGYKGKDGGSAPTPEEKSFALRDALSGVLGDISKQDDGKGDISKKDEKDEKIENKSGGENVENTGKDLGENKADKKVEQNTQNSFQTKDASQSQNAQKDLPSKVAFPPQDAPTSDVPLEKEFLSLQNLKKPKKRDDMKSARPEDKADLHNAIAGAITGMPQTALSKEVSQATLKNDQPQKSSQTQPQSPPPAPRQESQAPSSDKKEISEDELRKVLEVPEMPKEV